MCLAVPMRVKVVEGFLARCEARGAEREVNLFLLQHEDIAPGDLVMVHAGHAIEKMTEEQAASAWVLYDEILDAMGTAEGATAGLVGKQRGRV